MSTEESLTNMCNVMSEAYSRGWITTRDGNISVRNGNEFLITPSGVMKQILLPQQILTGTFINEDLKMTKPDEIMSGESEMHLKIQKTHSKNLSVVHLHPTNTIAAMFKGWNLQELSSAFPELSRYTNVGPSVHPLSICSSELAKYTFKNLSKDNKLVYDIVGQAQHGVTAIATTPWKAFEHIERLEHICEIILTSGVNPDD